MVVLQEFKVENISKTFYHFSSISEILKQISFKLDSSDINFLCGLNGCGKTTLFKILSGTLEQDGQGVVCLNNKSLNYEDRQKNVVFVPQNIDDAYVGNIFIYEYVSIFELNSIREYILEIEAEWLIEIIDFKKKILLKELSQGQRQLLLIVAMLSLNNKIFLFDEIFSSIDTKYQLKLWNLIRRKVKDENLITLFITHDYSFAFNNADKVLVLNNGKIVLDSYRKDITQELFIKKINEH